ncbi:MAG: hypothetical protein HETSPECPRED_009464 [Heterodermia speciosa]|uniref:DUF7730 domain-containing protein n=1 Tax=Heterodermia speciosa TaxID=116794 RepID=A0A8H3EVD9_9LECA|nr:MAG: hypothetical protein HETSPECPRED_009464 [Heterodermia speciosa]
MAGIMGLPLEIRNMIYEYCLTVNHTLVQCRRAAGSSRKCYCPVASPTSGSRKDLRTWEDADPTVTLLAVSKTVGFEAAGVLYGKNTWQISSDVRNPISRLLNDRSKAGSIWSSRVPLFRHVTLHLTTTDDRIEAAEAMFRIGSHRSMANVANSALYQLSQLVTERSMVRTCRIRFDIMKQMINLSSFNIHYDQFQIREAFEIDPKMKHRVLLLFCRFWRNPEAALATSEHYRDRS